MARAISSRRSRGTFTASLEPKGNAMNVARWAWCAAGAALVACAAPNVAPGNPQAEIAAMLQRSSADWNRGDLAGFMSDYVKDSTVGYVSGGHVQYGWQPLYDHYQATYFAPDKSRDSLAFEEVHVRPLAADLALCTARFKLLRAGAVTASGPFTLVVQKRDGRWRILHDHTSSDPK